MTPATGADDARMVAERARRAIAGLSEPHADADADADAATLTISVGVTAAIPSMGQPDQLIKVADQALYEAKRDGRNRIAGG